MCVCVCVAALAFILEPYLIQQALNKGSIIENQLIIWQQRDRLRDRWARAHLTGWNTDILQKEASPKSAAFGVPHKPFTSRKFSEPERQGWIFSKEPQKRQFQASPRVAAQDPSCRHHLPLGFGAGARLSVSLGSRLILCFHSLIPRTVPEGGENATYHSGPL